MLPCDSHDATEHSSHPGRTHPAMDAAHARRHGRSGPVAGDVRLRGRTPERGINTPEQTLAAWRCGAPLSGTLNDVPKDASVAIVVHDPLRTNLIAVNSASSSPRWFASGQRWRVTLTALPQLHTGRLTLDITARVMDERATPRTSIAALVGHGAPPMRKPPD